MRKTLPPLLVSLGLVTILGFSIAPTEANPPNGQSSARASTGSIKDRFVGTWKLVSMEQRNAKGEVVQPATPAPNRTGYIIYDPAGYVAVSIMPVGRKKYVGQQPTDEEAKAAMTGYAAYFGTFIINEKEGFVTHRLEGSVNPGMATDQKRFFELNGNRLTLKPPPGESGNQARILWERMPDVANPTAEQRRFFGFWKLVSNERRNQKGELVASNPGQRGYIIYTPAAFMMVQMAQPNRKPYAAAQPTPAEAREAIRTYANYFGPFYVHDVDGYVVHDQVGTLNVGRNGPAPQQRFYEFSGNRLLLHPPATYTPEGDVVRGTITWERVAPASGTR
jgi:hypothetical protein